MLRMKTLPIWCGAILAAAMLLVLLANPIVSALLRSPWHSVLSDRVLLLSYPSRAGGAPRTIPVNYLSIGNTILVGSDFSWWKSVVESTPVTVQVAGQRFQGRAHLVSDPRASEAGFRRLRPKTYARALATGAHLVQIDVFDGDLGSALRPTASHSGNASYGR
jgi:hypothetical protein